MRRGTGVQGRKIENCNWAEVELAMTAEGGSVHTMLGIERARPCLVVHRGGYLGFRLKDVKALLMAQ